MSHRGRGRERRCVDLVVVSDLHLGTVGCHAREFLHYLRSIQPRILVLNGDIIDVWQFSRYYWPKAHTKVLKRLLKMIDAGVQVYYVTGNHDELLRKFAEQRLGNFHLVNKAVLELGGKKCWIFHGDVFDVVTVHSRWLAKLGSAGYGFLILINKLANYFSMKAGRGRLSLSKRIKEGVKSAVKFIGDFEKTVTSLALDHGFDYVACGHIHQPVIRCVASEAGTVTYLNSGDWIENLTSLEYHGGEWSLFRYRDHEAELEGEEHRESDLEEVWEERRETLPAAILGFSLPR
jgi:UDP-2,3-diacylglucosamine pyrophosphatase LpxH